MSEDNQVLDEAIKSIVDEKIIPTECIRSWAQVPTGDIVVFLSDKDLELAMQPVEQRLGVTLGRGRTLVFGQWSGKWTFVSVGSWGGGVERLLKYFKAMASGDQNPQWLAGIELCQKWLLMYSSEHTQAKITDFMSRLDSQPNPGAVWVDFRKQFVHWARRRHFQT
jgi:hypothetical protein